MCFTLQKVNNFNHRFFVFLWTRVFSSILLSVCFSQILLAQGIVTDFTNNTACQGVPCGGLPQKILINEIMIAPTVNDGSISGPGPNGGRAEWIELFNPDACNSMDISCFILGNFTVEGAGGLRIPANTIVPPSGFAVIRGVNAPAVPTPNLVSNGGNTVEVVMPANLSSSSICAVGNPGNRFWFPNSGGWLAIYSPTGVPQDAARWGIANIPTLAGSPCAPQIASCPVSQPLANFNDIPQNRKFHASVANGFGHIGLSIRRIPDGGVWNGTGVPTLGECNGPCYTSSVTTCTGTATVLSAPGTAPHTYQWNDLQNQTSPYAIGLCAGTYTVTVTSTDGIVSTANVTISLHTPVLTLNNADFCVNGAAQTISGYTPIPTAGQNFSFSGFGVSNNQFNPSVTGLGSHPVTYSFTDQSGCSNTTTALFSVVPIPTVTLNMPGIACITDSPINVSITPAGGILTGPGIVGTQFHPNLAGAGQHQITYQYTDPLACTNIATFVVTANITVNGLTPSTFPTPPSYCAGANVPNLPTTSTNGFVGIWSPAISNTATTTYTFTPTQGQCAATTTRTINIVQNQTPTFPQYGPFCAGATISALPTTSANNFTGTWSPAINNQQTTTYTFTPTPGICATTTTRTINITQNVVAQFNDLGPYCAGANVPAFPTTSLNGFSGAWTPAINNQITTTYTWTPAFGQCAQVATKTISIIPNVTPSFTQVGPFCAGATIFALPTTSNNAFTGTWTPALNNNASVNYTFTPSPGQCATNATMFINIVQNALPSFVSVGSFCAGANIPNLPSVSLNNFTGTWSPPINNQQTTTYTFTPTAGLCATSTTMNVPIIQNVAATFTPIGSFCFGANLPAISTVSNNNFAGTWSPPLNNQQTTTYAWTPNFGQCATPTTMTVPIIPNENAIFNPIGSFCAGASLPPLPTTSTNNYSGFWTPALNNQQTTTYTFTPAFGQCANVTTTTITINPNLTPSFTQLGPICLGTSIAPLPTLSENNFFGSWSPGLNNTATTTYTFTPSSGQCAVSTSMTIDVLQFTASIFNPIDSFCQGAAIPALPTISENNFTGSWSPAINNQQTTTYTFTPDPNQCAAQTTLSIPIIPNITPLFNSPGSFCIGATILDLPSTSLNNINGSWAPPINNQQTTTYTFVPDPSICAISVNETIVVNPILIPEFTSIQPTCAGSFIPSLPTQSLNGVLGTWTPPINNQQTTIYTFTPLPSVCAVNGALEIVIVSGSVSLTCPSNQSFSCISLLPQSINNYQDFLNAGGTFSSNNALLVPNSLSLLSENNNGSSCNQTVTRTYQFTNTCAQSATCTQSIVINDNIPPSGSGPTNFSVQCISDIPPPNVALVSNTADNCSSPTVVHWADISVGSCPTIVTRQYRVLDACNNILTLNQIITVLDTIPPSGVAPQNMLVQCVQDVPQPNINSVTSLTDNCVTPTVTHLNDVITGICPQIITRTYRIEDACGNFTDVFQNITIQDTIAPSATAPQNLFVQCIGDAPIPNVLAVTNVNDNCVTPVVLHISDLISGTCPTVITRTYRVEDLCGNFIILSQTITVLDTIPPTATAPANLVVSCPSEVPQPNVNTVANVMDNCQNATVSHFSDVTNGNSCNMEVITRTYRIVDLCGNESFVSHTITIDLITPNASFTFSSPTTCQGSEGFITLSSLYSNTNYNISYNNQSPVQIQSNSTGIIVLTGLNQGSYTDFVVSYVTCGFCPQTSNQNIQLQDPPNPIIDAGADVSFCEGNSFFLQANNPENAAISWSNNILNNSLVAPSVGVNTYVVTAVLNNCFSTDSIDITVYPLPVVYAGADTTVCSGQLITLNASGAQTYYWTNNVTNAQPFYQIQPFVNYQVTGISEFGCYDQDQISIVLLENPYPSFTNNLFESCETPFSVLFENTSTLPVFNCNWIFDNNTSASGSCSQVEAVFESVGCFGARLEVEYNNGCTNEIYVDDVVCVRPLPKAKFFASPIEQVVEGPIYFTNASEDAVQYFWFFDDESPAVTEQNPTYSYLNSGQYDVLLVAVNEFGCTDTSKQVLYINNPVLFFVPNSFTPDNDNYNNDFKPIMAAGFDPYNYELTIFGRTGEILFVSKNANIGWPGTYGGELLPQGVYVWQILVKNESGITEIHRGHVSLLK